MEHAHLGKLAAYLRMLGFDTLYRNNFTDEELAALSSGEERILLTRDRGLLKRKQVALGFCVVHSNPRQQVADVVDRFALHPTLRPFTRCVHCNALLRDVPKQEVYEQIPARTRQSTKNTGSARAAGRSLGRFPYRLDESSIKDMNLDGKI